MTRVAKSLVPILLGVWGTTVSLTLPVVAQEQFNLQAVQLQQGTVIPVVGTSSTDPQYYAPDSNHSLTVTVSETIYNATGQITLPAGTKIYGQLQPVAGGLQFISNSLVHNGRSYPLQARSTLLPDEKDPRQYSSQSIAGDAAIGAAAGTALGVLTGGVSVRTVLGGALSGVAVGNVTAPQVVVLPPGQSFSITLETPLQL